jgi:hypothetical protein
MGVKRGQARAPHSPVRFLLIRFFAPDNRFYSPVKMDFSMQANFEPGKSGNPRGRPRGTAPASPNATRHRALVRAFRHDLGDTELTNAEIELIDMAATATLEAQLLKAKVLSGQEIDDNATVRLLNSAARLLNMIGIKKRNRKPDPMAGLNKQIAEIRRQKEEGNDGSDD